MSEPLGPNANDPRTQWLLRHETWLKLLAGMEIDSRFQGKFSASDAVQQTLLAAWQGWEQCRGVDENQRRAWLRQILAHQLAHLARHFAGTQKRDVTRELSLDASLERSSSRLEIFATTDNATPSGLIEARERSLQLAQTLNELPPDYREVLILRHLEDLPHEEVAKRMNRGVGAVRMLWMRALAELRRRIGE